MGLPCFPFIILQLFMPLMHAWILNGLHCILFILLELFMSLNACLDIKWAYLVFLHNFGIIHVS